MLIRLFGSLVTLLRVLTGAAFAVLIAAVLLQVVTRLALPESPVWTEELSRFALLYLVALGGGLALRTGELVNVDLLLTALSERGRRWLEAIAMVGVICFAAALVPPALEFVAIGEFQTSPALGWQMTWIHLIVLIAPLSLALFAIERLVTLARGRGGK